MTDVAENPLAVGLTVRRVPEPCAVTIFGASGDLTQRKLMPALYCLAVNRFLPDRFGIVGVARTEMSDDEFRARMREAVEEHGRCEFRTDVWEELAAGMRYVATEFADEDGELEVARALGELDETRGTQENRVYYLAIPPSVMQGTVEQIGRHRSGSGWLRLIVEKPFGRDADSARQLNRMLAEHFEEREIYRIDHYLGKETVQNMLGAAVRQRDLRADLEPPDDRPRPDHGGRVARRRGPRRLLRAGGRDPRHRPEPPAPARRAHGHGAADRLHGRFRPQREGQGAAGDPHAGAERGASGPVRAGIRRGRGGAWLPPGGRRRR